MTEAAIAQAIGGGCALGGVLIGYLLWGPIVNYLDRHHPEWWRWPR
jgi:hypothetical protein